MTVAGRLTDDEIALLTALHDDPRHGVADTPDGALALLRRADRLFGWGLVVIPPIAEVSHPRNDMARNGLRITAAGRACALMGKGVGR